MDEHEFCSSCPQENDCKRTYELLGKVKGPSVAIGAIVAFLVPIAVFIAALAAFQGLGKKTIENDNGRVALSAFLAICVTFACIMILKIADKRILQKKQSICKQKETENRD